MEKTQFETLMLAITGLDTKLCAKIDGVDARLSARIDDLDAKLSGRMDRLESKLDLGFAQVRRDIETIAVQTAKTVSDVNALNRRLQNTPSA